MTPLDPSQLPGTHRTRVFVGGSYLPTNRRMLGVIQEAVQSAGFEPILADQYVLLKPELDVHDVTMFLLHSCRLAVFELSTLSGALMEIERCGDYGMVQALVLYQDRLNRHWPDEPDAWEMSRMVKSLVLENSRRFRARPYVRPRDAAVLTRRFLASIRRSIYGQLHDL